MKTLLTIASFFFMTQAFAQSNTEAQIKSLSEKRAKWLIATNVDSLKNLYDENSITIHNNGMMRTGNEHLADLKKGQPSYKRIDIKESSVKDFGDTAVLVGKGLFVLVMNGQEVNYNMIYTEVYKKMKGQWKLILREGIELK